jgi:hypothetical protein
MVDPQLTYECGPLCAGGALFRLGSYVASEVHRSLGIIAFTFGRLVLVLAAVGRTSSF